MTRILLLFVLLVHINAFSQDVIQKQNGARIEATVINSSLYSISYRLFNSNDTTLYTMPKTDLKKISYANGSSELFANSRSNTKERNRDEDRSRYFTFKINPLSPLFGHTQIGLEQQIDKSRYLEYTFSLIGAGQKTYGGQGYFTNYFSSEIPKKQLGLSIGLGYKIFISNYDNRVEQSIARGQGFYLRPSIYIGGFSFNAIQIQSQNVNFLKKEMFYGAMVIEPGFQFSLTKDISIDFYAGLGYVFDNLDYLESSYVDNGFGYFGSIDIGYSYMYSVLRLSENAPGLAMTGGVKLGWTINKKSASKKK
jgi:hypothetical protein